MLVKRILVRIFLPLLALITILVPVASFLSSYLVVDKVIERPDAILVLSGGATFRERAAEAARLYHLRVAPKIYLTNDGMRGRWEKGEQRNVYYIERARRLLLEFGVPDEAIIKIPTRVLGTKDEAEAFIETPLTADVRSVLIVTSAFHTRRALWSFERTAAEMSSDIIFGITSGRNDPQTPPDGDWWLSSHGWKLVSSEYAKFVYYRLKY